MADSVSVSRETTAAPERVYAMVADLPRMGEWSPENQGGQWLDGASSASAGVRFRGSNRNGSKSWRTVATIVDADPGRRLAFRVALGPVKVSDWSYTFEPTPTGCRVTESWRDLRPGWFRPIALLGTGVRDRPAHNRAGMQSTLERLCGDAESQQPTGP